jgi:crotonobetainyl-CoA:carnitine CoA-transferase CaiB-like acyl-CoA transferase
MNLNRGKQGVTLDLKAGRELFLDLVKTADVVVENYRPGTMDKLGLGYDTLKAVNPRLVYAAVSGFGDTGPYRLRPGYDIIAQAMGGLMSTTGWPGGEPTRSGTAMADVLAGLSVTIGLLAALRHRDRTGQGQYLDVAMLDSLLAMTDVVTNFWSMGLRNGEVGPLIMHGFRAADGWFIIQVGREHQFAKMAELVGHPEWVDDERFATRQGWLDHLESVIRPAIEGWASTRTMIEACQAMGAAGVAAGPCFSDEQVVHDPHVAARHMLVEMPRTDGVDQPILIPGNPIKMSAVADGPDQRVPWLGEHTDALLRAELGLDDDALATLHADGTIA